MRRLALSLALLVVTPAIAQAPHVGPLDARNALSEIASNGPAAQAIARGNLGLGTASTQPGTAFDPAGVAATEAARATAVEATIAATANGALANSVAALNALLVTLPTTRPSTPGKLWLNGGLLCIS